MALSEHTIAVVIPALNEARLLPKTLARLPGFVDVAIVVDDASDDETSAVALESDAPCRVEVCRHQQNQGVGASIVTGYRWCIAQGIDIAVVMGADDQMHPDDMSGLLLPLLRGDVDYVMGNRLAWPGGWQAFPPVRLFGVVVLAGLTRWATGFPVNDAQCGYTAASVKMLARLPLGRLYGRYGFPNDMLAKVLLEGFRVTDRSVRPLYGEEKSALRISAVVFPLLKLTVRNRFERLLKEEFWPGRFGPDTSRGSEASGRLRR